MHRLRWAVLLVTILLVGVVASVACGEDAAPSPSHTPSSSVAPVATGYVAMPEPQAAPAAVATSKPTSSTAGWSATTGSDGHSALRVLNSTAAAAPVRPLNLAGLGHPSPLPMTGEVNKGGGLTVSANGSVTVAADEAYVVIILQEERYGPFGPAPIDPEDQVELKQSLTGLGFEEDAIEFEKLERYGPPTVSVEVDTSALPEIGESILDEVEKVLGRSQAHGLRFGLSEENCDQAVALARREAVLKAGETASDLAEALEVNLGGVIGAVELSPDFGGGYRQLGGLLSQDRCGSHLNSLFGGPAFPFDAEPEVEVSVGLQITYAIYATEE